MLAMIIESILPIDYYSNMIGILIDQAIFISMLRDCMPDLYTHFDRLGIDPAVITFQWFACFFSYNIQNNVRILPYIWYRYS